MIAIATKDLWNCEKMRKLCYKKDESYKVLNVQDKAIEVLNEFEESDLIPFSGIWFKFFKFDNNN